MDMYSEQELYEALEARHGKELQRRFSEASVAVCGLGGLGSNVTIALARAGVGRLILIDFDRVDLQNLNRQQYRLSQTGMYKTEAMRENILEFAPYCRIEIHTERLTAENIPRLLRESHIICECLDRAEGKAMLVNGAIESFPEKYVIAASGMSGLHEGNSIRARKITEKLFICGDGVSDVKTDGTLFAPRVMLCAAHQANTVLRIIAGKFEV